MLVLDASMGLLTEKMKTSFKSTKCGSDYHTSSLDLSVTPVSIRMCRCMVTYILIVISNHDEWSHAMICYFMPQTKRVNMQW